MATQRMRTTQGLRDVLFDEIDELRTEAANPEKSMAVANLAKQIINTAKVEIDFARAAHAMEASGVEFKMGALQLGRE
jgi:hypothetical protein